MTDATDAYHSVNWAARVESLTAERNALARENLDLRLRLATLLLWAAQQDAPDSPPRRYDA